MAESVDCPVCLMPENQWNGFTKARCGHAICMDCFMTWASMNATCPMCRTAFSQTTLATDGIMIAMEQRLNGEMEMQRVALEQRWQARLEQEQRYAQGQVRTASRAGFLTAKQQEFATHCVSCTDTECTKTHQRRKAWLDKGKLMPLPPPISTLSKIELGVLLSMSGRKCSNKKLKALQALLPSEISWQRISKFAANVWHQQQAKIQRRIERDMTKGRVILRTDVELTNLNPQKIARIQTGLGTAIKRFTGAMPPKRRARLGDIHDMGNGILGVCVGYHIWLYSNGMRFGLRDKKWVYLPTKKSLLSPYLPSTNSD